MIVTVAVLLSTAMLLVSFWNRIRDFLNGPCRDFLGRIFGAKTMGWYVKFVDFLDSKITVSRRGAKEAWKKFRETVLRVKSKYIKNADGSYTKATETIVRMDAKTAKRQIIEEEVPYEDLPDEVRSEMIRQRTDVAELNDRDDVIQAKFNERLAELVA